MSILPSLPRLQLATQRGGFLSLCLAFVASLGVLAAVAWWWINQPMALPQAAASVDLRIAPKSSARSIANAVAASGVQVNSELLFLYFRLSGNAKTLKAGSYEIAAGTSPQNLADMLTRGDQALVNVTIVEGWTFRQIRQLLEATPQLKATSRGMSEAELMGLLGKPGVAAEGRFFPDTYAVAKGSSDMEVLKSALRAMDKQLQAAWEARNPNIPLKSPEEALTLASIVEKETGKASDRTTISGVFNNRLRIGMRLQTDPTVIYGMGQNFDGNIRKRDLQNDTPWNTYTRSGLPPTPIAMPGKAALLAAVQPEDTKALYFVARGDGSSQFSASLDEHNRAVNKYIRGQ